jgi:hypothetical protein
MELVIGLNVRTADHFYFSLHLFIHSLIKNWLIFLIYTEICKESGTRYKVINKEGYLSYMRMWTPPQI